MHLDDAYFIGFGNGGNGRPDFQIGTTGGSSLDFRCGFGADTVDLSINTGGVFTGDFNDTSDERLKDNIQDIADNQINIVKQLRPVTFDWKNTDKGSNTGFIAQEVIKLLPNDVTHSDPTNTDSNLGINNIGITAGIECTLPKAEWIDGLNRMDMNIVPSNFTKQVLAGVKYDRIDEKTKQKVSELKLEKPMEVLFEGVDTNIYKQTKEFSKDLVDEMNMIKEKFCFLYVGHWLQGDLGQDRKDTGMLLQTFLETFKNKPNPPALIMKTSSATFSVIDRNDILTVSYTHLTLPTKRIV